MEENGGRLEDSLFLPDNHVIALYRGVPGPDTLAECRQLMRKATQLRLDEEPPDNLLFQYGPEDGDEVYLNELAKFLSTEYGAPVNRSDLVTTAGATSGLLYLLNLLFPHKCCVFVEEVSYFLAINAMESDLKYELVPVPLENDGLDVEAFEKLIISYKDENIYKVPDHGFWSVLYTIPEFHNPTGRSLSPEKSTRLLQIAQQHGVLVICEDVYNFLRYNKQPKAPRLFALDDRINKPGCVISNGSFTKYAAPGLRVGWIELPPWFRRMWMNSSLLVSGGCLNMYTSGVIGSALKYGLIPQFLENLRLKYEKRMTALCDAFDAYLPKLCAFQRPNGGYFVWIEMPENCDAMALNQQAFERYKIKFQEGWKFSPRSSPKQFRNCFRVSISYYDEQTLRDCVIKLCSLIEEFISNNKT